MVPRAGLEPARPEGHKILAQKRDKVERCMAKISMLVGKGGLEPPLTKVNQILSLARLPIPPLAQQHTNF